MSSQFILSLAAAFLLVTAHSQIATTTTALGTVPPQPVPTSQPALQPTPQPALQPAPQPQPTNTVTTNSGLYQPILACQQGLTACDINGAMFCLDEQLVRCVPVQETGTNVVCLASQSDTCLIPQLGPICYDNKTIFCNKAEGKLVFLETNTLIELTTSTTQPTPVAPTLNAPANPPAPSLAPNTASTGIINNNVAGIRAPDANDPLANAPNVRF